MVDSCLNVHVELSSICNGERPGQPSAFAGFLKSKLSNLISGAGIDAQLRVDEERDVGWVLFADVYCVDDDGCVLDAMLLGLVAALENTTLPKLVW